LIKPVATDWQVVPGSVRCGVAEDTPSTLARSERRNELKGGVIFSAGGAADISRCAQATGLRAPRGTAPAGAAQEPALSGKTTNRVIPDTVCGSMRGFVVLVARAPRP